MPNKKTITFMIPYDSQRCSIGPVAYQQYAVLEAYSLLCAVGCLFLQPLLFAQLALVLVPATQANVA